MQTADFRTYAEAKPRTRALQWGRCPDCYLSVADISVGSRPKRPGSDY